ncbi:PID domain-containing protein [Aphelenchoides bicaudatus]|nr:PID domain-containing protein [Aphelenchoides bicaudatus]
MSVPLCRCRVLYIGSAVPIATKDGLQDIARMVEKFEESMLGNDVFCELLINADCRISVWSNGVLIEHIDGSSKTEGAFYPIINLHYCAAVRYTTAGNGFAENDRERFIPLDSFPHPDSQQHPPIFAAVFRRNSGVKVLECHTFICTNDRAANALVRSCFHSYADTAFLKIEDKLLGRQKAIKNGSLSERPDTPSEQQTSEQLTTDDNREDEINWDERAIGQKTWQRRQQSTDYDMLSTESSIPKKPSKRNKKNETQSEVFENGNMVIPYNEPPMRRTGSQPDISRPFDPHHFPPFMPPQHYPPFMPPPGAFRGRHPMPPMFMQPPQHHRPPRSSVPPSPFFARHAGRSAQMPFPPPHPFFAGHPHFGRNPAYMHPMFMQQPPHFYSPQSQRAAPPTIPIIETIYDTYPRRGTYDETIYMPTNGTLPPNSTYKPGNSYDHYEGFYETYKRPSKTNGINQSDSDTSLDDTQFWDTYETGAYRKAHRNGTPKMNGEKSPAPTKSQNYGDSNQSKQRSDNYVHQSTPKIDSRTKERPRTPEIDYDGFGNVQITDKSTTAQHRQAAVF